MKSLLSGNMVNQVDRFIAKHLLSAIAVVVGLSVLVAVLVSMALARHYWQYEICIDNPDCFSFLGELMSPQIEVVKAGAAVASLLVIVSGAYLAIRSYLTASQVGMLGNAISHIAFFEKFIASEIARRPRLVTGNIDIFAIYELMFPRSHVNERFAASVFTSHVAEVFEVINESSRRYSSKRNEFLFDDHRRRLIDALASLHITMERNARIDFLETEDEVVEFLVILCRVFAPPEYVLVRPVRSYR